MKSKTAKAILFFVLSIFITMAAALPQIINRDGSYLTAGLVGSNAMFIIGLIILLKKPARKTPN